MKKMLTNGHEGRNLLRTEGSILTLSRSLL